MDCTFPLPTGKSLLSGFLWIFACPQQIYDLFLRILSFPVEKLVSCYTGICDFNQLQSSYFRNFYGEATPQTSQEDLRDPFCHCTNPNILRKTISDFCKFIQLPDSCLFQGNTFRMKIFETLTFWTKKSETKVGLIFDKIKRNSRLFAFIWKCKIQRI